MPEHVTFTPGQTITADGRTGIFFVDPNTGGGEAWLVPTVGFRPFRFTVGGMSSDGGMVVYTCLQEPQTSGPLDPCGGGPQYTWYLLDTRSGQRTTLDVFTGPFLSISPDGKTLLGVAGDNFSAVGNKFVLAQTAFPTGVRVVAPGAGLELRYSRASWNPDSTSVILSTAIAPANGNVGPVVLIDAAMGRSSALDSYASAWSPDGSRLMSVTRITDDASELRMLDRTGAVLWRKPRIGAAWRGTWSPDGTLVYTQVRDGAAGAAETVTPERTEILDAATGAAKYRIRGGVCPAGWLAATHRLIVGSYGFGQALVDLDAGTISPLGTEILEPTPFDQNLGIILDGNNFRSFDMTTRMTSVIAQTTVGPAWDRGHAPLFAGGRLVFTPMHGGHGGCGEGNAPTNPPQLQLLTGPFGDDPPVKR